MKVMKKVKKTFAIFLAVVMAVGLLAMPASAKSGTYTIFGGVPGVQKVVLSNGTTQVSCPNGVEIELTLPSGAKYTDGKGNFVNGYGNYELDFTSDTYWFYLRDYTNHDGGGWTYKSNTQIQFKAGWKASKTRYVYVTAMPLENRIGDWATLKVHASTFARNYRDVPVKVNVDGVDQSTVYYVPYTGRFNTDTTLNGSTLVSIKDIKSPYKARGDISGLGASVTATSGNKSDETWTGGSFTIYLVSQRTLNLNLGVAGQDSTANATVSPGSYTKYYGEKVTLPKPSAAHYTFDGWLTSDGHLLAANSTYTMTQNETLTAKWTADPKYAVKGTIQDDMGTVSNGNQSVWKNDSSSPMVFTPANGYHITGVTVDNVDQRTGNLTTWTFGEVAKVNKEYVVHATVAQHHGILNESTAKAPTCGVAGKAADAVCQDCGALIETGAPIAATGEHQWDTANAIVNKQATCKELGKKTETCTVCNATREVDIPKTAHDWSEEVVTTAATCAADGAATKTCTMCGDRTTSVIPATGSHTWDDGVVTTQATCGNSGEKTFTCTVCSATTTEVIPIQGVHSWNEGVVTKEANCTVNGETTITCTVCGATKTEPIVAPGHVLDGGAVTKEATCKEAGERTFTCTVCNNVIRTELVSTIDHSWNDGEVAQAATCGAAGQKTLTCAVCGEVRNVEIPKLTEHAWGEGEVVPAPSCTEEGSVKYTCTVCGTTKTVASNPVGHTETSAADVPATCCSTGLTGKTVCSVCGDVLNEGRVTPTDPNNHAGGTELRDKVDSTCLTQGYTGDVWCLGCNQKKTAGTSLDLAEHTLVSRDNAQAATCTAPGHEADQYCSVCNAVIPGAEIPVAGHKTELRNQKDATCGVAGYTGDQVCTVCGETIETGEAISALAHDYKQSGEKAATCTEDGYTEYTCGNCGNSYQDELKAKGHVTATVTVPASCTAPESTTTKCQNCDYKVETTSGDALGHNYVAGEVVAPTCTTKGHTVYTCDRVDCGVNELGDETDALGHNVSEYTSITAATCTVDGEKSGACSRCGETVSEIIPQLGHSFTNYGVITPATCCADGSEQAACDHGCGATDNQVIPATGEHVYVLDAENSTPATCTAPAHNVYKCSTTDCTATEEKDEGEALGHAFTVLVTTVEATCVNDGYTKYKCAHCDETETRDKTDALGHDCEWTEVTATCTTGGSRTGFCSRCDSEVTENIDALGHDWPKTWTTVTDPTTEAEGKATRACGREGCEETQTKTLPKIGESGGDWTYEVTKAPTCQEEGTGVYTNTVDGSTYTVTLEKTDHVDVSPKDHKCDECGADLGDHIDEDEDGECDHCGGTMEYTITYIHNDGTDNVTTGKVKHGDPITNELGKGFGGWFTDQALTERFNGVVTGPTTLYAGWYKMAFTASSAAYAGSGLDFNFSYTLENQGKLPINKLNFWNSMDGDRLTLKDGTLACGELDTSVETYEDAVMGKNGGTWIFVGDDNFILLPGESITVSYTATVDYSKLTAAEKTDGYQPSNTVTGYGSKVDANPVSGESENDSGDSSQARTLSAIMMRYANVPGGNLSTEVGNEDDLSDTITITTTDKVVLTDPNGGGNGGEGGNGGNGGNTGEGGDGGNTGEGGEGGDGGNTGGSNGGGNGGGGNGGGGTGGGGYGGGGYTPTPSTPSDPGNTNIDEPDVPLADAPVAFDDVSEDDWFYDSVVWAVKNDVTNGIGDGTLFGPYIGCDRAQIVTFLWRAAGRPEPTSTENPFTDVKEGDYFYTAVLWAVENGITEGYGRNDIFAPNVVCDRAQIAVFLWRAKGCVEADTSVSFTDVPSGAYYEKAVKWAVANGITTGTGDGTTYSPEMSCDRAQIVTFLSRAYGSAEVSKDGE